MPTCSPLLIFHQQSHRKDVFRHTSNNSLKLVVYAATKCFQVSQIEHNFYAILDTFTDTRTLCSDRRGILPFCAFIFVIVHSVFIIITFAPKNSCCILLKCSYINIPFRTLVRTLYVSISCSKWSLTNFIFFSFKKSHSINNLSIVFDNPV